MPPAQWAATQKLAVAILAAIQRISWYVCNNEQEFIQRVREASSLRQEETAKDCRKQIAQAKKRHTELDGLVKKLYEANATGKLPDKHFSRLLAEYDEEQATLEASITEWEGLLANWNADRVRMAEFIDLAKRYTDFSELTTPIENRQDGKRTYYHVYSIDQSPAIENHAMFLVLSPEELIHPLFC